MTLPIVLVSERFVIVDKPAGLLSVPGKGPAGADSVADRVRAMFPGASGPMVVHRLDMETSGLMVFGLDAEAQRDLSRQFAAGAVWKRYAAVLAGRPRGDEGEIDLPIRCDITRRPHQCVDFERGRPAVTRWRVMERSQGVTRVEFIPRTGRSHQLRLHAAAGLGTPILGDALYGDAGSAPRLMLHASELEFDEPGGEGRVRVLSAVPF